MLLLCYTLLSIRFKKKTRLPLIFRQPQKKNSPVVCSPIHTLSNMPHLRNFNEKKNRLPLNFRPPLVKSPLQHYIPTGILSNIHHFQGFWKNFPPTTDLPPTTKKLSTTRLQPYLYFIKYSSLKKCLQKKTAYH